MLVTQQTQLEEICARLREAGSFAFDTEFVQERRYYVQLGVVQVATAEFDAVVDPLEVDDLTPLYDLLVDPEIEKIVHAGRQDLEIVFDRAGRAPANIFDSQIAASFVGHGYQISLANLVRKITGHKMAKGHTLSDWTRRPLTDEQIEYSLEDVRYLPEVRASLGRRLDELGRTSWVAEEFAQMGNPERLRRAGPDELFLRMKLRGLSPQSLGVLREMVRWREDEAQTRDVPRLSIMRNEVLIELARRPPKSRGDLGSCRLLRPDIARRFAGPILEATERGSQPPFPELPRRGPRPPDPPPEAAALIRLLDAWVRTRAMDEEIASELVAKRADLDALVASRLNGSSDELVILQGWRAEIVGNDLISILEGRQGLTFDPKKKRLTLTSGA